MFFFLCLLERRIPNFGSHFPVGNIFKVDFSELKITYICNNNMITITHLYRSLQFSKCIYINLIDLILYSIFTFKDSLCYPLSLFSRNRDEC